MVKRNGWLVPRPVLLPPSGAFLPRYQLVQFRFRRFMFLRLRCTGLACFPCLLDALWPACLGVLVQCIRAIESAIALHTAATADDFCLLTTFETPANHWVIP